MGETMVEALKAEGRKEGEVLTRKRTLIQLLRNRFGDVPKEIVATIKGTPNVKLLDRWLGRAVTAATLADLQIGSAG